MDARYTDAAADPGRRGVLAIYAYIIILRLAAVVMTYIAVSIGNAIELDPLMSWSMPFMIVYNVVILAFFGVYIWHYSGKWNAKDLRFMKRVLLVIFLVILFDFTWDAIQMIFYFA